MIIDSNLLLGIQIGFIVGAVVGSVFIFFMFRWL